MDLLFYSFQMNLFLFLINFHNILKFFASLFYPLLSQLYIINFIIKILLRQDILFPLALRYSFPFVGVNSIYSKLKSNRRVDEFLIISNYYSMNIAGVFVCIMISGLLGILIYSSCDFLEKCLNK